MKKVVLSLAVVLLSGAVFAQKANVSKAKNKALSVESPDYKGARELIQAALTDPSTKDQASTWYVAGLIGYKEYESLYAKAQLGQKVDEATKGKAVMEAVEYFLKADELAQIPNAKGKIDTKMRRDILPKMFEFYRDYPLVVYGVHLNEIKDYANAYEVFKTHLSIPDMAMFKGTKQLESMPKDTTYYQYKYYMATFALQSDKQDEAIAIYQEIKDKDFESLLIHQLLYQEYFNKKDTVNYVAVLRESVEKFPSEPWFLQNLINHYIYAGQTQEAMNYLDEAILREPNVAQYHYIKGNILESENKSDEAVAAFQKAIDIDATLADAYAGLGRTHFNSAVKILDAASTLRDNREFNKELEKANSIFKQSLPYFKKASELKPDERDYKNTLRQLYYRLDMHVEYDAISKEMGLEE